MLFHFQLMNGLGWSAGAHPVVYESKAVWRVLSGHQGSPLFLSFFHCDTFILSLLPLVIAELVLLAIISVPRGVSSLANSDGWHHALHPYGH